MYRGRDEALRIYEARKRFYLLKAEEFEELKTDREALLHNPNATLGEVAAVNDEFARQEQELGALRSEVISVRKQTEDRLRRLDRQLCEVLYLKYIKQLSVTEICAKLCYSMQRIYQLLNKGVDLYSSQDEQMESCM